MMTAGFVSFAQNFEDVMLWRALKDVQDGFYIDIGAFSPRENSVTAAFYDRGWRGINVEPNVHLYRDFLQARPRDITLNVAVGDRAGTSTIYLVSNPALSTLSAEMARHRGREGYGIVERPIKVETLGSIHRTHVPRGQLVHFLKINVDGLERQVLLGVDWGRLRPWIVVVGATRPMSADASQAGWEEILGNARYTFAYADGLNRFYVANEHDHLLGAFAAPPNVFDGFMRSSEYQAITRANRSQARTAKLEAELSAVKSSASWRLTTPLRGLTKRLRSTRRRAAWTANRIRGRVATIVARRRGGDPAPRDQSIVNSDRGGGQTHLEAPRRLLVDVSNVLQSEWRSGIPRVVRSILRALPGELPGIHVMPVFATRGRPGYRIAPPAHRPQLTEADLGSCEPVVIQPTDIFLGLDYRPDLTVAQAAFFEELRRAGARLYFVVYDLLPLTLPHRFHPDAAENQRLWLRVVATADGAFCISEATAADLAKWLDSYLAPDASRPSILSFPLGADFDESRTLGLPPDAPRVLGEMARRPTFLMVGTLEARKGHDQALEAFELLWTSGVDVGLVLVGKRGWLVDALLARLSAHPELGTRLQWLEATSDEYLAKVYETADCLLFPSEGEGFGLPVIEALWHRTPVLARDLAVIREVAGEDATYFDGFDGASLASAIQAWLNTPRPSRPKPPDWIHTRTWKASATALAGLILSEAAGTASPNEGTRGQAAGSDARGEPKGAALSP
jgi:FkbM family methyltransferase